MPSFNNSEVHVIAMWMAKYKEPSREQTLAKSVVFMPLMNKNKVS